MIPFAAGVGRVAMAQAGREIGRQFGREVLQRMMGDERLGDILTREEIKLLTRRFGKATASAMRAKKCSWMILMKKWKIGTIE